MNEKKKNRRKFLRRSIQAMIVTPTLATVHTQPRSPDPARTIPEEMLPGDPGTRDPDAYGSVSEG